MASTLSRSITGGIVCRNRADVSRLEAAYIEPDVAIPERVLMAAILNRAFWDLNYISACREQVRASIQWFQRRPKKNQKDEWLFSFANIKCVCGYENTLFHRVDRAIREATEFLDAYKLSPLPAPWDRAKFARERQHFFAAVNRNNAHNVMW